jgi:hypothetical protein
MKKYLPVALALAAFTIAGAAPVLAQSVDNRAGTYSYAPNNSALTGSPTPQYYPGYGNVGAGAGPGGAW